MQTDTQNISDPGDPRNQSRGNASNDHETREHLRDVRKRALEVAERAAQQLGETNGNGKPPAEPVLIYLRDVEPDRVRWLWPGRIPRGKLTLLDGDPGLGKSTVALDLTARVTQGRTMPDGAPVSAGQVVILTAEDGLADTVRPRIDAMGGNANRVAALQAVRDETGDHPVSLPEHLNALRMAIIDMDACLVVVDPFNAFLASYVNSRIDHDIRRTLAPLAALAEETGIAVILIRHLNKATGGPAIYRGGGSIGIIAAARAGLIIAEDPDDPSRRILAVVKSNLAPRAASLAYRLEAASNGAARVVWDGESPHSATALLAAANEPEERSALDDAKAFLRAFLAEAPRLSEDVLKAARREGHADKTVRRAKDQLGVRVTRDGFGSGSRWYWSFLDGQPEPKVPNSQTLATFDYPNRSNPASGRDFIEGGHDDHLRMATYENEERAAIQSEGTDEPPPDLVERWSMTPPPELAAGGEIEP